MNGASVAKSVGEHATARDERIELRIQLALGFSREIVLWKIDPSLDLREHAQRPLLELTRDLAEPPAEIRLRQPQRALAAGVDHLE